MTGRPIAIGNEAMTFGIEVTCLTLEVCRRQKEDEFEGLDLGQHDDCNELPAGSVAAVRREVQHQLTLLRLAR